MLKNELCDYTYVMRAVEELSRSEFVQRDVLTHSILGREIPVLTLGRGKRGVLYVGAHHGMEWLTAGVLLDFVADFVDRCERNGQIYERRAVTLCAERCIRVVPMLNPDGVEYAIHGAGEKNPLRERVIAMNGSEDLSAWQANARGVDLNHNYHAGFLAYKQQEAATGVVGGAPTRYSGEFPESEPETAALCRLLRYRREEIEGVLSLHSPGEEIFCSCGDALSAKSLSVGRVLQRLTGYRMAHPEGLSAFGGLTDWCITELKRPAYTLECGNGKNPLPLTQRPVIYERLRRALFTFPYML